MADSASLYSPRTPPCRPFVHQHHKTGYFPTDATQKEPQRSVDDGDTGFGMPESVSLGAFPMFLLQDSPTLSGSSKPIPQFPESPESTFGFQSPSTRTSPQKYTQLQRLRNDASGAGSPERRSSTESWDSQSSTPTKAPNLETRIVPDNLHIGEDQGFLHGRLQRKLGLVKAGAEFGRRLYQDEDETLVGHHEVTSKKLRPVLSFSSATSTVLTSPLSDTFSPGSASCSDSASSSHLSPCHEGKFNISVDEFPTEVGGTTSLDLQEPCFRSELMARERATGPDDFGAFDSWSTAPAARSNAPSSFAFSTYNEPTPTNEIESPLSQAPHRAALDVPLSNHEQVTSSTITPPRPILKRSSYNHLVHARHPRSHTPLPSRQQTPNSSLPSTVSSSPEGNHRRAFSGASERLKEFREELIAQSTASNAPGRSRSSSVTSNGPSSNNFIEQAARSRSRSNSASGVVPPETRTLNSMPSKDSFRTKFANLPGYVSFLREITLEIWIDQEGFRAIRPQFELHRYTPGQRAPVRPIGLAARPASPTGNTPSLVSPASPHRPTRPRTAQPPMTPPRQADEIRRPSSSESARCSPQTSPVASRFLPVGSGGQEIEQLKPQFLENWGVAEFTMKKRRGWNFHYGMVDGDPVIRRLTVDGVEDRDYLSREASLSVRSNGVYTVKGSEDRGKFSWKFEYLVEDRRAPTGAIVHGEKTLTPLMFSCAPELLIPEQGKKVKLLHVMKKSVIPKISASKMDPPLVFATPGNTSAEELAHGSCGSGSVGKTFETLAKMVRPSSHGKSRPSTPKHVFPHAYSPSQTPVHHGRPLPATVGGRPSSDPSEGAREDGRRRAASYSNMRPDLKKILGDGYEG